ncbi:T9SS type A sorting domain-containing protein [Schleiferia thermophila]|jgi:dienelactone hydrolase|uniref:T9SS type A sorting domain-containing protein n=1 Tax=Schleiferia thermophila TaxID=884107 RepID=UPI002FDB958C
MRKIYSLSLALLLTVSLSGQRYLTEVFTQIDSIKDIQYGQALAWNNDTVELYFDLYKPANDSINNRPLIILAHGGSFISGSRQDELINDLCRRFARRGYVTVSISYRLGVNLMNFLNISEEFIMAAVRGTQDFNAAVRFFKKSFTQGNPYGIDTTRIAAGGYSAGSLAALHSVFLRDTNVVSQQVRSLINLLGGIEGNSGSAGFNSQSHLVINIAGAVLDTQMILSAFLKPVISFHGTADNTVKFGRGFVQVNGFNILQLDGSSLIDVRIRNLGGNSSLFAFQGVDHDLPYDAARRNTIVTETAKFLFAWINGTLGQREFTDLRVAVYPNPAREWLSVTVEQGAVLKIYSATGQLLLESRLSDGENQIDVQKLPRGLMFLNLVEGQRSVTRKVLLQ